MSSVNNTPASLPETGFVRLSQILQVIPVGRSTWLKGVKAGDFPQPVRLGAKCVAWRVDDIRRLISLLSAVDNTARPPSR